MHCPNCGQHQISDQLRFCSRCGLELSGLAKWLAGRRLPMKHADDARISAPDSPRRKGIRRAGKLMLYSGVLFPVFLVFTTAIDQGEPIVIPFLLFFISVVWMLYARLFSDDTAPVKPHWTNELAQPPSVTENTTRLLDDD